MTTGTGAGALSAPLADLDGVSGAHRGLIVGDAHADLFVARLADVDIATCPTAFRVMLGRIVVTAFEFVPGSIRMAMFQAKRHPC